MMCSCNSLRTSDHVASHHGKKNSENNNRLVILADDTRGLFSDVLTGIHVASRGEYSVLRLLEEGFEQSALLAELISIRPHALIALGPRSAHAIAQARIILPSAFSLVPRIENYELDNVFCAGIRMVADAKEQISLIRALMPELKFLGVMFSRQNSRNLMQSLRGMSDDEQFDLVGIEVQTITDVLPSLTRFQQEIGAVLMIDDPILLDMTVLDSVTNFLSRTGIAFFALDCSMVRAGALASLSTNYFSLGRDLVNLVSHDIGSHRYEPTKITNPSERDLCINLSTIKNMKDGKNMLIHAVSYAADKQISLKFLN